MQTRHEFRWVYTSLGLWLMVSPFLLFGGQVSLMNARIVETGVLMLSGLAALWVACLSLPKEHLVQALAGLTLGLSMILAPEVFSFAESSVTVLSAKAIGLIFVVSALVALYDHRTARRLR